MALAAACLLPWKLLARPAAGYISNTRPAFVPLAILSPPLLISSQTLSPDSSISNSPLITAIPSPPFWGSTLFKSTRCLVFLLAIRAHRTQVQATYLQSHKRNKQTAPLTLPRFVLALLPTSVTASDCPRRPLDSDSVILPRYLHLHVQGPSSQRPY
ncbi:hypothetical protein B0T25DRAFT_201975 [Lasiosphaeria hispida]|uniref:Secreted protein n=1 Tax=Lasiosphaeria hispida TaxID=260671 RepID=A0AAJ0ME42_9PEZI|nr:hypothetical protein B0T25DRAFT_201975 [Lasiosphaeria hispida]